MIISHFEGAVLLIWFVLFCSWKIMNEWISKRPKTRRSCYLVLDSWRDIMSPPCHHKIAVVHLDPTNTNPCNPISRYSRSQITLVPNRHPRLVPLTRFLFLASLRQQRRYLPQILCCVLLVCCDHSYLTPLHYQGGPNFHAQ